MKLNIIAIAIAVTFCASANAAEVFKNDDYTLNIGGRIHSMVDRYESHNISSGYARINVSGTSKINESLGAFTFVEKEFSLKDEEKDNNRDMYVGLSSDYGDIFTGRFGSALEQVTDFTDIMMTSGAKASGKIDENRESGAFVYRIKKSDFNFIAKYKPEDYNYEERKETKNNSYSTSVVYSGIDNVKLGIGYADTYYWKQVEGAASFTYENFYLAGLLNSAKYEIADNTFDNKGIEIATAYRIGNVNLVYTYNKLNSDVPNLDMSGALADDPSKENHSLEAVYLFNPNLKAFVGVDKDLIESRDYTHFLIGARYDL